MNNEPGNTTDTAPKRINNHLVGAVLTTLFCCQIGGIISIVYACQVNGASLSSAMQTLPKGTYVVRVTGTSGTRTLKITK